MWANASPVTFPPPPSPLPPQPLRRIPGEMGMTRIFTVGNATYKSLCLSVSRLVSHTFIFSIRTALTALAHIISAPAQLKSAPAQLNTAPAQLVTAPAQLPATGAAVFTALFW